MTSNGQPARRRLGEVLVAEQVITVPQLEEALAVQAADPRRRRLGQVLRDLGLAADIEIATALARQLGLPLVDLDDRAPPKGDVIEMVPRHLAAQHDLLPLAFDATAGLLTVAMADPTNVVALDDLRTLPGVRVVSTLVAGSDALERAAVRAYEQGVAERAVEELGHTVDPNAAEDDGLDHAGDEPVIRLVNALLAEAVRSRASDVHVEPERRGMRVRFRVDGMLREVQTIPQALAPAVTSRLKVMSNLDIAERRRPQDGRAAIRVDGQEVDLRVSTMPTLFGETTVLRLLRKGAERLQIADLGFDDDQRQLFNMAISRSQGLIVMTGPTGSGKTTTLYAGLSQLSDPERNVVTLEDPVEYQLEGVNQSQMQPKIGITFAAGLRTILRQDPDVIMVGEIRDPETATLAVEASFTGHLVLSTLHTNDAPSTVARLVELGVDRFLVATTLQLVVAQRLVRSVCGACAAPYHPHPATLEQLTLTPRELQGHTLRRGHGCRRCDDTGYHGRVGLYEFLPLSGRLRQLVSDGGTELQIGALARAEGMRSLRQDGIDKALRGVTTLEEVLRATPEDQFRHELVAQERADERASANAIAVRVGALAAKRLLVVGDDPLVEEANAALPAGWSMTAAPTLVEGQRRAVDERPDIILMGATVDGEPSTALVRELRRTRHDQTPVVVRTETPLTEDERLDLLVLGVTDHLVGPPDPLLLRASLDAARPT